jgi:hypothetical protein
MRWRVIPLLLILGGGLWTALGPLLGPGAGSDGMGVKEMAMSMGGFTGRSAHVFYYVAGGTISLAALVLLASEERVMRVMRARVQARASRPTRARR